MFDDARDQDRDMLSAWIARGQTDVDKITESLVTDGAVASFQRALDDADLDVEAEPEGVAELSEDEYRAGITSLVEWAAKVNGRRDG